MPALPLTDYRAEFMEQQFSDLQIARFNELYYKARADAMRKLCTRANLVAAISSSAALVTIVGGWTNGKEILGGLSFIAASAAAVVPVLQWEAKAATFEKAALGYSVVRERVRVLLKDMKLSEWSDDFKCREAEISALRTALMALDEPPHKKTIEKAWDQALKEYPSDQAWSII